MSYFELKSGEKLHYVDTQAGEKTLVLLHGWTSSHQIYLPLMKRLKGRVRCIAYDQRGHGKSREANRETASMELLASDLQELLTGLGLEQVNLLGWSMGAGVVMTYLKRYGTQRLRSVILCDMTPKQLNDAGWSLGLYKGAYTARQRAADAEKSFFDLYREFALAAMPALKRFPRFLLNAELRKIIQSCDEKVLTDLSASMKDADNRDCFRGITVPVSYIYADPGTLFSPKLADWYARQVPSPFRCVKITKASHLLMRDQPEQFARAVEALL